MLKLKSKLRNPVIKVLLYVPKEFKRRFAALKKEDYRIRKLAQPRHKTKMEYTDDDIVLFSCLPGHSVYNRHYFDDLPNVDIYFQPPLTEGWAKLHDQPPICEGYTEPSQQFTNNTLSHDQKAFSSSVTPCISVDSSLN